MFIKELPQGDGSAMHPYFHNKMSRLPSEFFQTPREKTRDHIGIYFKN